MSNAKRIMTAEDMARSIDRLAFQVIEKHKDCTELCILGIQRRGAHLAARLRKILQERLNCFIPLGSLDISFYRDDWTTVGHTPSIGQSDMPFEDVAGKEIILVDDVLYSGRTVRAALEAILDYGRPARVESLTLIDRGGRELPIQADYVGQTVNAGKNEQVDVLLTEQDGRDEVLLKSSSE